MSLTDIFDATIESLREPDMASLICTLCQKAQEKQILKSPDEGRFLKVVSFLLGTTDYDIRKKVSEQLLHMAGLPSDVYLYFACDDIAIAKPFLEPDFALSSSDLLHIARYGTTDHRMILVTRRDLNAEIVREIMKHDESVVIRELTRQNEAAVFFEYDDTLSADKEDEADMLLEGYDADFQQDLNIENPLDIMIRSYAEKSRFADIIELLARQSGLPKEMVKTMFSKKDVEQVSILCRGLGIGEDAFGELARFRCRRLGQLERLGEQATEAYGKIDIAYAEAMLNDLQGHTAQFARSM